MRGVVLFILIVVHIDIFSVYNLLVWERIGVISGAEGFVILSGMVLGMVHRKKIDTKGWHHSSAILFKRAFQIYRVNLTLILLVALIGLIYFIDSSSINSFTNHYAEKTYPLMPGASAPIQNWVNRILLLRVGPHQTQVLGLYVVLLLLTPFALWLLYKKKYSVLLSISWILYFYNWDIPTRLTQTQFEYAFPSLAWQLIFFHALAFGYFKNEISNYLSGYKKNAILIVSSILFLAFMFFTFNNPNPSLPDWYKLSFISPDTFNEIYTKYFRKNSLGILRLLNYTVALIVTFSLLSYFWKPIEKYLGWFFIPFGQATLYVFILHLFMCLLINNIPMYKDLSPSFFSGNIWLNTFAHTIILLTLWIMVKKQVWFKWIPR